MTQPNWLHDEDGNIHKALHSCSQAQIDDLAAKIDARTEPFSPPCTFDVRQGDELLLAPEYRNERSWGTDWVVVS